MVKSHLTDLPPLYLVLSTRVPLFCLGFVLQLAYCVVQFLEKDPMLTEPVSRELSAVHLLQNIKSLVVPMISWYPLIIFLCVREQSMKINTHVWREFLQGKISCQFCIEWMDWVLRHPVANIIWQMYSFQKTKKQNCQTPFRTCLPCPRFWMWLYEMIKLFNAEAPCLNCQSGKKVRRSPASNINFWLIYC